MTPKEPSDNDKSREDLAGSAVTIAHWFIPIVGLIYGSGFLVEFTYFKSFGITDIDFVKTKYIHIGCIFLMACLVVVFPFGWLIWFWRKQHAESFTSAVRRGELFRDVGKDIIKWLRVGSTVEELHSTFPFIGTVSLMLWNFFIVVAFTDMKFAKQNARLIIFNFALPLVAILLALIGDAFEKPPFRLIVNTGPEEPLNDEGNERMRKLLGHVRLVFRLATLWIGLITFQFCFLTPLFYEKSNAYITFYNTTWHWMLLGLIAIIAISFLGISLLQWKLPDKYPNSDWWKLNIRRWVLYAIQWWALLCQVWVFAAIAERLEISLAAILFGKDWPGHLFNNFLYGRFPSGSVYFVLLMTVILLFSFRSLYRLKQIEDTVHKRYVLISTLGVLIALFYLSILSFSRFIFPFIPETKGGGDYTAKSPVEITFPTNSLAFGNINATIPKELKLEIDAHHTIILDQNSTFIFLVRTNDEGGPSFWRSDGARPKVFEIRRDTILNITYTADKDTPSILQKLPPKPTRQMTPVHPQS